MGQRSRRRALRGAEPGGTTLACSSVPDIAPRTRCEWTTRKMVPACLVRRAATQLRRQPTASAANSNMKKNAHKRCQKSQRDQLAVEAESEWELTCGGAVVDAEFEVLELHAKLPHLPPARAPVPILALLQRHQLRLHPRQRLFLRPEQTLFAGLRFQHHLLLVIPAASAQVEVLLHADVVAEVSRVLDQLKHRRVDARRFQPRHHHLHQLVCLWRRQVLHLPELSAPKQHAPSARACSSTTR
eukprot:176840-Rhodomonas_salina.2